MRGREKGFIFHFSFVILSAVVLLLETQGYLSWLHGFVGKFTVPVESSLYNAKRNMVAPLGWFHSRKYETETVKELEAKNAELSGKVASFGAVLEENKNMRKMLGAQTPPLWHFEVSKVTSVSADAIHLTGDYVPSIGTTVVFVSDDSNVAKGGVFVGRVEEVHDRTFVANLPTHSHLKIPVIVRDTNGNRTASGILVGQGGMAVLDQVLAGETLPVGAFIVTSGEGGFPPELFIGTVSEVLPLKEGAWQQAKVKAALDYTRLETVFFVTKY